MLLGSGSGISGSGKSTSPSQVQIKRPHIISTLWPASRLRRGLQKFRSCPSENNLQGANISLRSHAPGRARQSPGQKGLVVRAEAPNLRAVNPAALSRANAAVAARPLPEAQSDSLMAKIKAAWAIFFPRKPEKVSAKEAGKSRLRMILVADRCGMNQASMYEMRHSIVKAVSDFVEIEAEDLVEVNISTEPELGTVYSVAVPVRRVKAPARFGSEDEEGTTIMFDAESEDQADRFPYGC